MLINHKTGYILEKTDIDPKNTVESNHMPEGPVPQDDESHRREGKNGEREKK